MKASDPQAAIDEFLGVPGLEQEKGDWGFKGLKQAIKLEYKLALYDKVRLSTSGCMPVLTIRPSNIIVSSSHTLKAPLPATTPKSLSTTSSII